MTAGYLTCPRCYSVSRDGGDGFDASMRIHLGKSGGATISCVRCQFSVGYFDGTVHVNAPPPVVEPAPAVPVPPPRSLSIDDDADDLPPCHHDDYGNDSHEWDAVGDFTIACRRCGLHVHDSRVVGGGK